MVVENIAARHNMKASNLSQPIREKLSQPIREKLSQKRADKEKADKSRKHVTSVVF